MGKNRSSSKRMHPRMGCLVGGGRARGWPCFDVVSVGGASLDSAAPRAAGYLIKRVMNIPQTRLGFVKAPVIGPRQSPRPITPLRALCLV